MDFQILDFIQTHVRTPFLDDFFSRITHLGDAGTIWILIAVILLFTKKYRKAGVGMLIAMLVTYILGDHIIKPLVGRARPFTLSGYQTSDSSSGPVFFSVRSYSFFFLCRRILVFIRQKAGNPSFCPGSTDRVQQAVSVCTLSNRCPRRDPTGHCLCSHCVPAASTQWTRRWNSLKRGLS